MEYFENIKKLFGMNFPRILIAVAVFAAGALAFAQKSTASPAINQIRSDFIDNDKYLEKTKNVYCSQNDEDLCDFLMAVTCNSSPAKNYCTLALLLERVAMEDTCKDRFDVESCKERAINAFSFIRNYTSDPNFLNDALKVSVFSRCIKMNPYQLKSNLARSLSATLQEHIQDEYTIMGNIGLESCIKRGG